jgi:hypothetical protein
MFQIKLYVLMECVVILCSSYDELLSRRLIESGLGFMYKADITMDVADHKGIDLPWVAHEYTPNTRFNGIGWAESVVIYSDGQTRGLTSHHRFISYTSFREYTKSALKYYV